MFFFRIKCAFQRRVKWMKTRICNIYQFTLHTDLELLKVQCYREKVKIKRSKRVLLANMWRRTHRRKYQVIYFSISSCSLSNGVMHTAYTSPCTVYTLTTNQFCSPAINVWTIDTNKSKTKSRRNSQQLGGDKDGSTNTNENIIQATNQKFGTNGKITVKKSGLGHEGKYTPKWVATLKPLEFVLIFSILLCFSR